MPPLRIAHRGFWWPDPAQQNTPRAFEAAARAGFGLELDVRRAGDDLVIRHGPGEEGVCCPLAAIMLPILTAPLLAWNLKDLKAPPLLAEFLGRHDLAAKSVVFDQELLATGVDRRVVERSLAELGLPHLVRASDAPPPGDEPLALALVHPIARGVWLDCNGSDWVTAETLKACRGAGKASYVVSPELHGRPLDLALWVPWQAADGICTDFPHLLAAWEAGAPLEPVDPWWAP